MQTNGSPGGTFTGKNSRNDRPRIFAAVLSASVGLLIHSACTTSKPPPQSADAGPVRYIITADTTPFFKYGPAQANGPDYRLKKDQEVTMVERHYGYSRVLDPDGHAGYIPTDDIAPAANQPPAPGPTPKKSGGGSRAGVPPDFDQPNDSALPSKQPPSDAPVPSFRY